MKKDTYGKCGIKEYWIVDVENRAVEAYLLADNKLEFHEIYEVDEKFKTSLFDELIIDLEEVFADIDI